MSSEPSVSDDSPGRASSREWRLRLVLLAFSAALVFLVGEVALRLLASGAPKPVASESGFSFFAHDERLGWDLVPGAVDRHGAAEFDVEIRIDERGLRSARSYDDEPAPGIRRLAVLGDSFTFGHGVEASEAWPALLEHELPALEAPNLAVTGYGTDQQLLRFEERADELKPDAVILGLFAGNVFRNARFEQLGYNKPRFAVEGGQLRLLGVPVPEQPPTAPASLLWALFTGTAQKVTEHLGFGEAWEVTGGILDRLAATAQARGGKLYVLILPKDQMVYGSGPRRALHERMHGRLHQLLDERGVAYLDLTDALRAASLQGERPERLYYPQDGHWTVAGHRVAAEAVAEWLAPQLTPLDPQNPQDPAAQPVEPPLEGSP